MRSPGRDLREFSFDEEAPGQEVRAVERRALLETLASKLPPGAISFSSKLKSISEQGRAGTLLELEDGRQILAKIVVGCDGVNSPIARWMGFSEPRYVGHMAFRGLAEYADGQPFEPKVNYIYGRGVRAGFVPVSATKVYWFICFNRQDPGPKITDPTALKTEALELVRGWPSDLLAVMRSTPEGAVVRTPLVDRWLWPRPPPPCARTRRSGGRACSRSRRARGWWARSCSGRTRRCARPATAWSSPGSSGWDRSWSTPTSSATCSNRRQSRHDTCTLVSPAQCN